MESNLEKLYFQNAMISPPSPKKVWVCEVQVVYGKSSGEVKQTVGFEIKAAK